MNKLSFVLVFFLIVNVVLADTDDANFKNLNLSIKFISEFSDSNLSNQLVVLKYENQTITKRKTNENGELFIPIKGLPTFSTPIIYGTICIGNVKMSENLINCSSVPFHLPLFSGEYKSTIIFRYRFNFSERKFNFSFSDNDLIFCSYVISDLHDEKYLQNFDFFKEPRESCYYEVSLNQTSVPSGTYFLAKVAADSRHITEEVNQFFVEDVETKNPFGATAIGSFEITGAKCFFENGRKNITLEYFPNEHKNLTVFCPDQNEFSNIQIGKNFKLKKEITVVLTDISNGIVSIIFTGIFYYFHNPTSRKKGLTKELIFVFLISWFLILFIRWFIF